MQRTYQFSEIAPTRAEGELAELLLREGLLCQFSAGTLVQQQGDEGDGFWLIKSGTVSLCRFAADGNVTIYGVLGAGDLFGELAYFAGVARQVDAIVDEDAALVRITAPLIERLLATAPDFARWLLKSLSNQLRLALDRIEDDRQLSAEHRLILALVDMARRDGPQVAISQQKLGELIGVSRITAGHILRRLADGGEISLEYRRITVHNPDALARMIGTEAPHG
jgi:CRP-like cAMP-binding protein